MILGMDQSRGGRLWAAWVSGGDSELAYVVIATSDDGGGTWSAPQMVIDPSNDRSGMPRRALVGNVWADPMGKLWLFFDMALGFFDGRGGVWAMTCDDPDTDQPHWSEPRRIWHGATLNKPTVLADGTWLLPISLWRRSLIHGATERARPSIDRGIIPPDFQQRFAELDSLRAAHVFASSNGGQTWSRRGCVVFPNFSFDEHMFIELRDGRIWMTARNTDGIYESYSHDQGRSWSEPRLRFQHIDARFFMRRLASGRILFVKHGGIDQRTRHRSHLTAFLSDDEGQTWRGGLLLDEREGVSYPDGFESPNALIHIVYDHNRYSEAEILLATFREEDILAGELQSKDAKLRRLVNCARGARTKLA